MNIENLNLKLIGTRERATCHQEFCGFALLKNYVDIYDFIVLIQNYRLINILNEFLPDFEIHHNTKT